jgi:hypothetical protein
MRTALLAATALVAVSFLSQSFAQNQLPPTTVRAPKPKPITAPVYVPVPSNGNLNANANPTDPNAVIDPTSPNVRAKDWNAPGAVNLHYMTDAQFAAFEMKHPSAVVINRCYVGQDPDLQVRSQMRAALGRSGVSCVGGGG